MAPGLKDLIRRAESWPEEAQAELVELGLEIEAEQRGEYRASDDELKAIAEALSEIDRGEAISEDEANLIFAKLRNV